MVAWYVDDGLMAATYQENIDVFLDRMRKSFALTITRCPVTSFLGVQVVKNEDGSIFIHQELYTTKILDRFNMSSAKPASVPIEYDTSDSDSYLDESMPYQAAVGSLLYLSNGTRPDITYAVNSAARHMQSPKVSNWNKVKHILRYLISTVGLENLKQSAQSPGQLDIYSDADFAGDIETKHSITGYTSLYSGGAITWSSQLQSSVSLSTKEIEFMAASQAVKEALWLIRLFGDICVLRGQPTLMMDNQTAI